ncbi:MAG: glycine zipper domain-containing protein [Candidatus Omnitrophota bacterium]
MKRILMVLLIGTTAAGCTTTQKSTGVGAVAGAGLGAIIGHQSGDRDKGALIGGALGALGGYAVGKNMEEKKFCPVCGKVFPADTVYCPHDGTELKYQQK